MAKKKSEDHGSAYCDKRVEVADILRDGAYYGPNDMETPAGMQRAPVTKDTKIKDPLFMGSHHKKQADDDTA